MMRLLGKTSLLVIFLFNLEFQSGSSRINEIIPLKSKRVDVERILGEPTKANLERSLYEFPMESVSIEYSMTPCARGWNVEAETVTRVIRLPKEKRMINTLGLDLRNYRRVQGDRDVPDHLYYLDEKKGVRVSVRGGIVHEYILEPKLADQYLRCPDNSSGPFHDDCLPVSFSLKCSSQVIVLGACVDCWVEFAYRPPEFKPIVEWTVQHGANVSSDKTQTAKVRLINPALNKVSLSVSVTSPKICFPEAAINLEVVKPRA